MGKLLKHSPTMGGCSERGKFESIYTNSLDYYKSLFGQDSPKRVWETLEDRFADTLINCASLNIQRLANISLY